MNVVKNIPPVWQRVGFFVILTYAISAPFEYMAIVAGSMGAAGGLYALGGMWSPGIAAFITALVFRKEVGSFGWRWGKTRYQIWSILIPFLYCLIGYGLVWLFGLGGLMSDQIPRRLTHLAIGFSIGCVAALGEEIGWSGFLVPELAKSYGFTTAALTRGIVWSVWHYPMIIAGIYRNACIQTFFTRITSATAITAYFIDEFGAALALLSVILGFAFWKKRTGLPLNEENR
jgi:membrane protease YdiL (CAAX protease family)